MLDMATRDPQVLNRIMTRGQCNEESFWLIYKSGWAGKPSLQPSYGTKRPVWMFPETSQGNLKKRPKVGSRLGCCVLSSRIPSSIRRPQRSPLFEFSGPPQSPTGTADAVSSHVALGIFAPIPRQHVYAARCFFHQIVIHEFTHNSYLVLILLAQCS